MELNGYRARIDEIDRALIELLEARMDVAEGIAAYKRAAGKAILDTAREQAKLDAVRAQCRPETAALIGGIFESIMAASRAYQAQCMEADHGG